MKILLLVSIVMVGLSGEVKAERISNLKLIGNEQSVSADDKTNDKKPDLETTLRWIKNKLKSQPYSLTDPSYNNYKRTGNFSISNFLLISVSKESGGAYNRRGEAPACTITETRKLNLNHLEFVENHEDGLLLYSKGKAVEQTYEHSGCSSATSSVGEEFTEFIDVLSIRIMESEETRKRLERAFNHLIKLLKRNPENQEDLF